MKTGIRIALTGTASASLLALTGCAGLFGPDIENPPALSEIDEQMWESMEEAGSVTLVTSLDDLADMEPQSAEAMQQMFGEDVSDMKIYGALDGSGTAMSVGDDDLMRVFGKDEAYLSADAVFGIFENQNMGFGADADEILSEVSEDLSGSWIDFGSELESSTGDDAFDVGALFDQLQESWKDGDSSETPIDRDEISDEGIHEVRDEQDVWVYEGEDEGQELVLEADPDAPKILEISDGDMTMSFTKWGETEEPEHPEDSDVLTQQDLEQRVSEAMMGGSF